MTEFDNTLQEAPIYSVTEISLSLKQTVERTYGRVRIRGEVSSFKRHTSGHSYFALKDSESVMDAVAWRGSLSDHSVKIEEGLEIIATGRLTTYPSRSKYQMIVESFEPTGQGALLKLLEERKARLAQEGLFDSNRKKPLPPYPQKIGIVTSPTGAVIKDILHRLEDRYPCHVLLWPVLVQGQGAAEQIANAIEGFNKMASPPDLIIVARGGGSLEDLWAFNEEIVVRAAAASQIPLISAVGHETDTTLIDFASDRRAPTPTAAAEMAVPVLMDLWAYIQDRQQRLSAVVIHELDQRTTILLAASRGLPDITRLIEDKMQRLDDWSERLPSLLKNYVYNLEQRLVSTLSQQFRHSARRYYELTQQKFILLLHRLEHGSYQKILDKGFCWTTTPDGAFITRAAQVKKGAALNLHFVDGVVPVVEASSSIAKEKKPKGDDRQAKLF